MIGQELTHRVVNISIGLVNIARRNRELAKEKVKKNEFSGSGRIGVMLQNEHWRVAKKLGARKDPYYGWILRSMSSNGAFDELVTEVQAMMRENEDVPLRVRTQYL